MKIVTVLLLLTFYTGSGFRAHAAASLGINYGKVADNLPAPAEVVSIIQSISITKAKLYDTDPLVLKTFRNTDISFLVAVRNEDLGNLADQKVADSWIQVNILPYHPDTHIIGIVVGNEIFSSDDTGKWPQVLPAMVNIYQALVALGLDNQIMVSTTHSFAILSSSFPPSSGAFEESLANSYIKPILSFLSTTGAPFMINAYPFFAYKDNPSEVSLGYVLFEQNDGVVDSSNGLRYYNMFDAQLDSVYSAISKLGYNNISILVSETGWPSQGDNNETGATIQNAQIYHANLLQHLSKTTGTPLKPNSSFDVYLFALFNEDKKNGPTSERHYGLFYPDGSKVYNVDFSLLAAGALLKWHCTLLLSCTLGVMMALFIL
ncbi:hypothetical protein KP509_07G078800 [Ceratopteris richardii]|uniref:glucan endo-1,3-beta-D-glucosidase n=2 Tax=Ceratopteris richardii TaxID=49495 RepID=A0A8T2UBH4_CERRI|nr:hypothetical protein KP509_07G078800 [Ceratopteris richardii]